MNKTSKRPQISLDITLMYGGYNYNDLEELMQEPFYMDYSTRVGYQ